MVDVWTVRRTRCGLLSASRNGSRRAVLARLAPAVLGVLGMVGPASLVQAQAGPSGSQLTQETAPAGTLLSDFRDGGRIISYHRGHLYLGGLNRTTVYNIDNPRSPVRVNEWNVGANGHRWWKMGDLFWREYEQPEVQGSGYQFADLSDMPNIVPWTREAPLRTRSGCCSDLDFFPYFYEPWSGHRIIDQRSGQHVGTFDFRGQSGVNARLQLRIGNLFFMTTEIPNSGMAVFDVSDIANVRLLDVLRGDYFQYTTFYAVWRNYIVFTAGSDINEGGNNVVAIDFSDPANLRYAFGFPSSEVTSGRYIFFQDEYGFVADGLRAVKINMETRVVEELPVNPPRRMDDFQVIPVGHLLVVSGSQTRGDNTYIFTHQDGLDTRAPYVGYHLPADGALRQSVTTTIGLVINETLDNTTVHGGNIHVRRVEGGQVVGDPLQVDVISSQHNVINVTPRQPLQADATYQVRLVPGGIRDAAGNGIEEYVFYFSTGNTLEPVSGGGGGDTGGGDTGGGDNPPVDVTPVAPTLSAVSIDPGLPVQGRAADFSVTGSHPDGVIEYRWRFGDGSSATSWTTSPTARHTYASPGHYSAVVQARVRIAEGQYETTAATRNLVVSSTASLPERDLRSTPIALDSSARVVWNVNPDSDTVTLINADSLSIIREIQTARRPTSVAIDGQGRGWITAEDSDQVQVFTRDGQLVQRIFLNRGSRPTAVVITPDGKTAFVAEYAAGRVRRFDTETYQTAGVVDVGPTPKALALTTQGELYVSRFISPDDGGQVHRVTTGSTLSRTHTISLPLDSTTVDNGAAARGLPNYVGGFGVAPGEATIWYTAKKDNILRGERRDGLPRAHDAIVRTLVGVVDVAGRAEQVSRRVDIDDSNMPSSVAISPFGAHAFVTLQGNNRVSVLDVRSGEEVASVDVGLAPQGVVIDPATGRVFVHNFMGRSVTVLDGELLMREARTEVPVLATLDVVAEELLVPEVLQGKRIFYNAADPRMSLEGYISCASCHANGGHDGRVWDTSDIGEGLRRTISMRGRAGMAHGRLHWSGNFDEVQDFEIEIRRVFGGTGFIPDELVNMDPLGPPNAGLSAEMDALAAYVASLDEVAPSPFRNSDGSLTAAGERGREVFLRQNCSDCHSGPEFTDSIRNRLHDVGTLRASSGERLGRPLEGIDTPTLLGLWENTRFLHDGRAFTLREVFQDSSARTHGGMDRLTDQEMRDLEAFLLQIDTREEPPPVRPAPPAGFGISVQ